MVFYALTEHARPRLQTGSDIKYTFNFICMKYWYSRNTTCTRGAGFIQISLILFHSPSRPASSLLNFQMFPGFDESISQ